MSVASGGRWSSLFGYGRGTGGPPSGWECRNRRGEFLLCWLTRGYEDREGRGGVEGGRKQVYELKKRVGGRETSKSVTSATAWLTRE